MQQPRRQATRSATRKTKTDMPGVALAGCRSRGGRLAFVDFTIAARREGEGKPHAKLGTKRGSTYEYRLDDDSPESSAKLLGAF
jgi:hypothetical protein